MSETPSASTAFPLGYYGANPDGNDPAAEQTFESQYNAFVQAMGGARPLFMNAFVDLNQDPSEWGANASWTAWSWAQTGNNYVGPNSGTTPVIGVPMASNADGWSNVDQFYQGIISGQYDDDYKAIVDAWAQAGYTTIDLRLGYEFDGTFMPWSPDDSDAPNADADFVAAWQHLADLVHAEGKADGITVDTVWNPDDLTWTATPVTSLYPGDQYVDIVSSDVYSSVYPADLTDWTSGGTTQDATIEDWFSQAANREHYWQYTDANFYNPTGDGSGWSFQDAVDFAQAHGKPLAISETGAGGDGTTTGPVDDPAFPQWLAGALDAAEAQGVAVPYVDIWDASLSDGDWDFSDPGSDKPLEEASWGQYFGAGSGSSAASTQVISNEVTNTSSSDSTTTVGAGMTTSDPTASNTDPASSDNTAPNGAGQETVFAQSNGGTYFGSAGTLTFVSGASLDSTVVAGQGNAVLYGAPDSNIVSFLGTGQFMLDEDGGSATVVGASDASDSAVLFAANGGSFTLFSNTDGNVLTAGSGNATLNAGAASGSNTLFAGAGDDSIVAGAGDNVIVGGPGNDTLIGGAGSNLFEIDSGSGGGNELIGNWNANDQLDLFGYDAPTAPGLPAGAAATVVNGSEVLTLPDGTNITFLGVANVNTALQVTTIPPSG